MTGLRETTPFSPCLYRCKLWHRRLKPFAHFFAYRLCYLYIDIDKIEEITASSRFFSAERPNIFSLYREDMRVESHSYRDFVNNILGERAGCIDKIMLLTMPRLGGYVFNPLSVYYCFDQEQKLDTLIYDVRNRIEGQHFYCLSAKEQGHNGYITQFCEKKFYVSPLLPMECQYMFRLLPPGEHLRLYIRQFCSTPEGQTHKEEIFQAGLRGQRLPLSDYHILKMRCLHPWQNWKTTGAIHWQAFKLWRKGAKYHAPALQKASITYG